jgi:hypothetical protein
MSDEALVVAHTFNSRPEADIAASALEAAGIAAMIRADDGGGQRPAMAWAGVGFEVIVREGDVDAAREILEHEARNA